MDLLVDSAGPRRRLVAMAEIGDGVFAATRDDVAAGDRNGYVLDGEGPFPDPASRFQPDGVHGPSMVVDPGSFVWSDRGWRSIALRELIIYELHVGTFTPEGTFAGVTRRLSYLSDLGVTAVELMPVSDFPGRRNWGYDPASLFAPARCYGTPDDLRRLVDRAHALGLAVLLDVVYNHFGPDGAYAQAFSPFYLSSAHSSPWGKAVNLDGDGHEPVRAFFIESALHWLCEYHADGLRLDATHALVDDSPSHFCRDLATEVRAALGDRPVLLVAEDDRNFATIVRPEDQGGWGFDAVWADDSHHEARVFAAGDRDGYDSDYAGSLADVAETLRRGWFFRGQHSAHWGKPRGTDPAGLSLRCFVVCLQNHDQIGNRPFGNRLTGQIDLAVFRALSAVLLFAPETPLLFMGQEWAASTPFLYFTDHNPELGRLVTEGRRREFARFDAFADERLREPIPDPQAEATFEASRLRWSELAHPPHSGTLALYRALLQLRREPVWRGSDDIQAVALDAHTLALKRGAGAGAVLLLARLGAPEAEVEIDPPILESSPWTARLTTEDPEFLDRPGERSTRPELATTGEGRPCVRFARPSAIVLARG